MGSPAQTRAIVKYIKEHTKTFVRRCNKCGDADIIEFLSEKPNVAGYLKALVREDMRRGE